ncbi:hypothetical protein Dimus_020758 [Dionaea muscipula]
MRQSLATNAALALQLNAHSATCEEAQQSEIKLQEENAAFERAITNYESKIHERLQEVELLQEKLKEIDKIEDDLRSYLINAEAAIKTSQSDQHKVDSGISVGAGAGGEASESAIMDELDIKNNELYSMEETVQALERTWADVQDKALKLPSPAQREKALDKQLHSQIEQLAAMQAQAEGLVSEIHLKEKELDRLNAL